MGVEIAGFGLGQIFTAVSAVSSIIGGFQQQGAAEDQAAAARAEAQRQANLQQQEREIQARAEVRENIELEKRQKLAFLSSGVSLEGSPLLLLAETKRKGAENIEAITRTGRTEAGSILASGEASARAAQASGRSALIGGLTGGLTKAGGIFKAPEDFGRTPQPGRIPIPGRKPILQTRT